jgi:Transmembrane amino acid transporter protein
MLIMAVTATAGFATFGAASDSLILNNYSLTDSFMSTSRLAVTISLLFSYPLAFSGLRQGFLDLFGDFIIGASSSSSSSSSGTRSSSTTMEQRRQAIFTPVTIGLLSLITAMAFVLKDIRILLAFGGATYGNCIIYLFPSLMMIKTILATSKSSSAAASSSRLTARSTTTGSSSSVIVSTSTLPSILLPAATAMVGLILGVVGTIRAVQTFV